MDQEPFENVLAYSLPDMDQVVVKNVTDKQSGDTPLTMDIYYPPGLDPEAQLPVVIFIMAYADPIATALTAAPLKNFAPYVSWGHLTAASGLIGVAYQTLKPGDLEDVVAYIRENAASLNMDPDSIGLWSCSGNGLAASSFAMQENREYLKFGVFYYAYLMSTDDQLQDQIIAASAPLGCYAAELEGIGLIRQDLPLLIAKAGHDTMSSLNKSIDHFVSVATENDVPLTLINYEDGVHGFDYYQLEEESGQIIKQTLEFMRSSAGL